MVSLSNHAAPPTNAPSVIPLLTKEGLGVVPLALAGLPEQVGMRPCPYENEAIIPLFPDEQPVGLYMTFP